MSEKDLLLELKCKACGHTWIRRTSRLPRTCPRCKHYKWMDTEWEVEHDVRPKTKSSK